MLLSIIISTKDKPRELLTKTLAQFLHFSVTDTEIIVVDQNIDKRMQEVAEHYTSVLKHLSLRYISSATSGLSKGRNVGLKVAQGSWLLFFDDDAVFKIDVLTLIKTRLLQDQDKQIIYYGTVLNFEDDTPYITRSRATTEQLGFFNFDTVCSIGLLFNRKVLEEIGFFAEDFGVGSLYGAGEEADLILRALSKKIPVRFLKQFIVHHPKALPNKDKAYIYGTGLGALYRKHLTTSIRKFFVLGSKFLAELMLRLGAIIVFFMIRKTDKVMYHARYLRGFIHGFKIYQSV